MNNENKCKNGCFHNEVCHCRLLEDKQNSFAYYSEIVTVFKAHYPQNTMPFSCECIWCNLESQELCPKFVER